MVENSIRSLTRMPPARRTQSLIRICASCGSDVGRLGSSIPHHTPIDTANGFREVLRVPFRNRDTGMCLNSLSYARTGMDRVG